MPVTIWVPRNSDQDQLNKLENRSHLFYDETATVYVELTHGPKPASVWLETTLSGVLGPQKVPLIYNLGMTRLNDADIIRQTEESIIWGTKVAINHPRSKSVNPQVHFQAGIVVSSNAGGGGTGAGSSSDAGGDAGAGADAEPLPDFEPVRAWNVFDSYHNEPGFSSKRKHHDPTSSLTTGMTADLSMPVVSALSLRLSSANLGEGILVASVEVSTSEYPVAISDITLEYPEGQISAVEGDAETNDTALSLAPHEVLTKVFKLRVRPSSLTMIQTGGATQVSAPVKLSVTGAPLNETLVVMKWDTSVNFELNNIAQVTNITSRSLHRSTSNTSLRQKTFTGLSLTCSGPSVVEQGSKFAWELLAVNRAGVPRQLCFTFTTKEEDSVKPGVLSSMREIRSGVIVPQACFKMELPLLAIRPGLFALPDVRILDITSGASHEGMTLPSVLIK